MTPLSAPFYVDTNSGVIRVEASLDRETIDTYSLTVTASDRDPNIADIKSSTVNVTVTLTDVNDNDPVFFPDHYKVTTKEKQLLFSCLNLASSCTLEFSVGRKRCVRLEHSDDVSPGVSDWLVLNFRAQITANQGRCRLPLEMSQMYWSSM